ncbi:hypothetical protein ACWD4V_25965 [Streptomyces tsukubensis]|uniref:hypothetical protein n=1 Tax=Streptomyces tsukubensis TaxID=83656 RepID=UPI00368DB72D
MPASRPDRVHDTVERASLTGRIGRPLITVHGTLDVMLPISRHRLRSLTPRPYGTGRPLSARREPAA